MTGLGSAGFGRRPRLTSSLSVAREAVWALPGCCGAARLPRNVGWMTFRKSRAQVGRAARLGAGARRRFDLEAMRGRGPGDAGAEIARRRVEGARQLHDRAEARLAAGTLEQRDLGAVEIAAVAQLFLGDTRGGAGEAEVGGEPLLRNQVTNSSKLKTVTLQTKCFVTIAMPGTSATFLFESSFCSPQSYTESIEH